MTTQLKKNDSFSDTGHTRYSVIIDGHYVGWVCKDDGDKYWSGYVTSKMNGGEGTLLVGREDTRREAVEEIEFHAERHAWRLEVA